MESDALKQTLYPVVRVPENLFRVFPQRKKIADRLKALGFTRIAENMFMCVTQSFSAIARVTLLPHNVPHEAVSVKNLVSNNF